MFRERDIIYFKPFYFKNGKSAPKNKYFVVLKCYQGNCILASLPTSKNHLPSNTSNYNGCIEMPELNLNCFLIPNTKIITECGKKFKLDTYLYGREIDTYEENWLRNICKVENKDYEHWGVMNVVIFEDLLKCFKNSRITLRKYKKLL